MTQSRPLALAAVLALSLLASGCKKAAPEPEPQDDTENVAPETAPAPPPVEIAPKKPAVTASAVKVPADTGEPSADEQMREDAEATGMTSRMPPEDTTADPDTADPDTPDPDRFGVSSGNSTQ